MSDGHAATWRLDGRTALVTGGTRGIGRAVADELAALGANVIVVARSPDPTCPHEVLIADVTSERGKIVERISGPLHVLVHNAGTNVRGPLTSYEDSTIERLIHLNLTAPLLLSRDLHPRLKQAGDASVIHVGSVAGHLALPTGVAYASAKAGLAQAARTLALEWAHDGIRVNTVAPWYTKTPLVEPVLADPVKLAAILAATPLARVAEAHEVARPIAFLALPAASYITGQCISVDGGMSIQGLGL